MPVPYYLLALCLLCCLCTMPTPSSAQSWQEKTSTHFRVFYQQDAAFAAAVLRYAEVYYTQIRLDLGLTHVVHRDQIPWLGDKRCQIFLYPNRQAYHQATGAPAWSGGFVNYPRRMVYSHLEVPAFLEQTLPHELAHIMFREFVGFENHRIPRWLDEGVAQYAESNRREGAWDIMRQGLAQGIYIPLEQLNSMRDRARLGRDGARVLHPGRDPRALFPGRLWPQAFYRFLQQFAGRLQRRAGLKFCHEGQHRVT